MIEANNVSKSYGSVQALRGVTFSVGAGEVVGLLGPNGAGKTTLLRILTGYFEPTDGTVHIDGVDVVDDPLGARSRIGYLPEATPLYPEMLVQESLLTIAEFRGIDPGQRRRLISDAVWATGLHEHLTRPIAALSKGFKQRVGLAQAILHRPRLLVLDEPTSGLDPTQVDAVRDLVKRLSRDTTVLFSTHILPEVEQVCDRALVILDGELRLDASLESLRRARCVAVALPLGPDPDVVQRALGALPMVDGVRRVADDASLRFELDGGDVELARAVFRAVRDAGWELAALTPLSRDLETVFRDLVRGAGKEEAA